MSDLKRFDMNGTPHVSGQYCNAQEAADLIESQQQRIAELEQESKLAKTEALLMVEAMHKDFYSKSDGAELFEPLDTAAGLLTQIDNMYAGIREEYRNIKQREAELASHVELLQKACTKAVEQVPEIACILGFAEATQMKSSAILNAARREVAKEAWFNAYDTLEQHMINDVVITSHKMTDLAEEYINHRYPDKE